VPPVDWPDEQARPVPFNNVLVSQAGVNTGGGYTAPGLSGLTVAAYKTTAVTVNGHGTAVSAEVGWQMDGAAAATVAVETNSGGGTTPTTLLFINQGHKLDHVKLTGGGNVDYSVVESNQLPLPPSAAADLPWAMVSIAFDDPGLAIGATNVPVPYDLTNGSDTVFMTSDAALFSLDSVNHALVPAQYGFYAILTWTRCRQLGIANVGNFAKLVSTSSNELPLAADMTSFLGGNSAVPGYNAGGNTFWDPNSLEFADARGGAPSWQHIRSNTTGAVLVGQRSTFAMVKIGADVIGGLIP